jgi:hypothetical protein
MSGMVFIDRCDRCGGVVINDLVLVDAHELEHLVEDEAAARRENDDLWLIVGALIVALALVFWWFAENRAARSPALPAGSAVPRLP